MHSTAEKLEQEFLTFYEKYADAIFRHCYFRVYDREKARDLMQETFLRAWKEIASGTVIENMRAYLYRVANNLVIDESRRKKAVSLDGLQEAGVQFENVHEANLEEIIDGKRIIAHLDRLDEQYRDVLVMRFIDGLKPREIAEILSVSANVISVRIHRGIQQLRGLLHYDAQN